MANIFNDLNKLVNTVQKVDKLLTEKPKRVRTRTKAQPTLDDHLRGLIACIMSRPQNERIGNLNNIVDNLNELGTDYTITLKTNS
jgi:hypothetical protein